MPGSLLKYTSALISFLTETGIIFNYWIVSNSTPSDDWPNRYSVSATITAIVYALVEPALTFCTLWIPIPQKFLLTVVGMVHLSVTSSVIHVLSDSTRLEPIAWHKKTDGQTVETKQQDEDDIRQTDRLRAVQVFSLSRSQILLANLLPVLTAAWSNAALFLFTHSMHASDTRSTPYRVTDESFEWLAIITYVFSVLVCNYAFFTGTFEQRTIFDRATITSVFGNALLLWILRACARMLFGMSPISALTTIYDTELADELFNPARYKGITNFARDYPVVLILVVPLVFSQSSFFFAYFFSYRPAHERLERLERTIEQEQTES